MKKGVNKLKKLKVSLNTVKEVFSYAIWIATSLVFGTLLLYIVSLFFHFDFKWLLYFTSIGTACYGAVFIAILGTMKAFVYIITQQEEAKLKNMQIVRMEIKKMLDEEKNNAQ